MRTEFELADIIRRWGADFLIQYHPNLYQQKVLRDITLCRTAALGGHEEQCDCCNKKRYTYNSCGNRHCPKCQNAKQAFWIEDVIHLTLPVKHYHIIFTVPHELNEIAMMNSRWFYNCLFEKIWDTLRSFGYTHYGVETGAIMTLHTWGQNLSFHPHVHCIVAAAGQTPAGNLKHIGSDGKFLFPVKAMSKAFQGKIMQSVKRFLIKQNMYYKYKKLIDDVWQKKWNINCEPALGSPDHIVHYLGQYINRVAISNHRILNIDEKGVLFLHKDYRDDATVKPIYLDGVEFLRRFCMHILPKQFVKIRYYGIYSSRYRATIRKKKMLLKPKKESSIARISRLMGIDVMKCPFCKNGVMRVIRILPRIRAPDIFKMHYRYKNISA